MPLWDMCVCISMFVKMCPQSKKLAVYRRAHAHVHEVFVFIDSVGCRHAVLQSTLFHSAVFGRRAEEK